MNFERLSLEVWHQTVVVQSDPITFHIKAHQLFKVFIIACFFEDNALFYASVDDVIIPRYLDTWFSWHDVFFS